MSLTAALKEKITAVAQTKKIADLQKDISTQESYLTTDHGVSVSDTDNWWVALCATRDARTLTTAG